MCSYLLLTFAGLLLLTGLFVSSTLCLESFNVSRNFRRLFYKLGNIMRSQVSTPPFFHHELNEREASRLHKIMKTPSCLYDIENKLRKSRTLPVMGKTFLEIEHS